MKICLLGGSNSVMGHGLRLGLDSYINLAIGASSSCQNIHAIISNEKQLESVDVIVTESNVNDSYNIREGVKKKTILENIDYLYDELYRTGKIVISIIIPVKRYNKEVESDEIIESVNAQHIKNSKKYGFYYIDLTTLFCKYEKDTFESKAILPDPRHPSRSFMYHLGCNIKQFIKRERIVRRKRLMLSNFKVIPFKNGITKSNSNFQRDVHVLTEKIDFNLNDYFLCGIETWSDNNSQLVICNLDTREEVIKNFNSLLSFNEISSFNLYNFSIESKIGKIKEFTEVSINTSKFNVADSYVGVTSLLVKNKNSALITEVNCNTSINLSFIVPDIQSYIESKKYFIKTQGYENIKECNLVNKLRDLSILAYMQKDIELAVTLMRMAHEKRPSGFLIKDMLMKYEKELIEETKSLSR